MAKTYRWRATLGVPKRNYPELLALSKFIYNSILANPTLFATPNPPLPTFLNKIEGLDKAEQAVDTGTKGMATARNAKAYELITALGAMQAYVQVRSDESENGDAIIEAAGMTVAQTPTRNKPILQAKQSAPSSAVQVIANVGALTAKTEGRVLYNWESSSNGGQTWTPAPSTAYGRTHFAGLTPMVTYAFRVSVTDESGPGEWSPVVTLLVR